MRWEIPGCIYSDGNYDWIRFGLLLVADGSMIIAYNESFEKYNIEDGNLRTAEQIYKTQREEIEKLGIKFI